VIVVWTAVAWSLAASKWTFSHPILASRQSRTDAMLDEDVGSDVALFTLLMEVAGMQAHD